MDSTGHALRMARQAADLPQATIAKLIGRSKGYVSDIECGRRPFPRASLASLVYVDSHEHVHTELRDAVIEAAIRDLQWEIERLRFIQQPPAQLHGAGASAAIKNSITAA